MPNPSTRRTFIQRLAALSAAGVAVPLIAATESAAAPIDLLHPPPPPPASPGTTWRTSIVSATEPGDRLVVHGTVFAPDGAHSVPGVDVYAYNTDIRGFYAPDGTVYPPRISGYMKTDAAGRFELHTIVPGRYPHMRVPAHVHWTLQGAGYPVQWRDEIRFAGDSYLTAEMIRDSESRGKFATIQPLVRAADGVYHCSVNLRLQERSTWPSV